MKKAKHANCGASVKAANGGYMQVQNTAKLSKGGMVDESMKTKDADRSKFAKRAEGVKASKGGMVKKSKKSK